MMMGATVHAPCSTAGIRGQTWDPRISFILKWCVFIIVIFPLACPKTTKKEPPPGGGPFWHFFLIDVFFSGGKPTGKLLLDYGLSQQAHCETIWLYDGLSQQVHWILGTKDNDM